MVIDPFGRIYNDDMVIVVTRRVTSSFLKAIPKAVAHFDAYIYAVIKRNSQFEVKEHQWGMDVRLDPCVFNWNRKTITIYIPLNINYGITGTDDLNPNFYESIEAAFLSLMFGCCP